MTVALGYQGKTGWEDLSDYLVHFPHGDDETAHRRLMSILRTRSVYRGPKPLGAATNVAAVEESQRCVCLTEILLGYLHRLADRRSRRGIAFARSSPVVHDAAPVWYLDHDSEACRCFRELVRRAMVGGVHAMDPIWVLARFVEMVGRKPDAPFDRDFRWEREWRVPHDVHFEPRDISFVLLPEPEHAEAARMFSAWASDEFCAPYAPLIDPAWSVDRVRESMSERGPGT